MSKNAKCFGGVFSAWFPAQESRVL